MRPLDRLLDSTLAALLLLGGIGHTAGTIVLLKGNPEMQLWSFCGSLFVFTLGALNLVRTGRRVDHPIAWICLLGNVGWFAASLRFGQLLGNLLDPRVLIFLLVTAGLCVFSARSLRTA